MLLLSLVSSCCLLNGCGSGINSLVVGSTASAPAVAAVSNGPQLGYLWNAPDSSLRPILGIPGSSQFGQSVVTPGAYVNAAASIRSSLALLQSASGAISIMAVPQGSAQVIPNAIVNGTAQIVFSPAGLNAVIYRPGSSSALLLTALNTTPQALTLTAPASLLAATVSDTAQVAAVYGSVTGSSPLTVALLTGNHSSLASLNAFGGLSFLPGGSDLLFADSSTNALTLLRNTATAPASQTFNAPAIQSPLAVAASNDGLWAVVANGADPSVVRIDLTGATAPLRIACACQPTRLAPLNGNAVFSLNAPGTATTWVADASAPTPRTVFIPSLVSAAVTP